MKMMTRKIFEKISTENNTTPNADASESTGIEHLLTD